MRVLHLGSGNMYGGIEAMLVTMASARPADVDLEQEFGVSFEGRFSNELRSNSARVHHLGEVRTSRPWTVLAARQRLRSLLGKERFHAVICHAPWTFAIFGRAVRGSDHPDLIFWAHNRPETDHWLDRWAFRRPPRRAICNSRCTAEALRQRFPDTKLRVIHPPVAPLKTRLSGEERRQLRFSLGAADSDVVIIQASRLEHLKGHRILLQALAQISDVPGWICWITGGAQRDTEKAYLDELIQLSKSLGIAARVRFLGERSDIPMLMQAADIHCQPNEGPESFGIAFIEALAAGIPVVTTAIGGAVEIVDSSCGILVPPGDVKEASTALRALIADRELRRRLGEAGPARSQQLCDPSARLLELVEFLAS
jgi:Glycosyltransferase